MMPISFGLGEAITMNAIIGLPTFKQWKFALDVDANRFTSKLLCLYFDLSYQHAVFGFPPGVTFTKDNFMIPQRKNENGMCITIQFQSFLETIVDSNINDNSIVVNLQTNKTTTIASPSDKSK